MDPKAPRLVACRGNSSRDRRAHNVTSFWSMGRSKACDIARSILPRPRLRAGCGSLRPARGTQWAPDPLVPAQRASVAPFARGQSLSLSRTLGKAVAAKAKSGERLCGLDGGFGTQKAAELAKTPAGQNSRVARPAPRRRGTSWTPSRCSPLPRGALHSLRVLHGSRPLARTT